MGRKLHEILEVCTCTEGLGLGLGMGLGLGLGLWVFNSINLRPVIPPELTAVVVAVAFPSAAIPLPLATWLPLNLLLPPASALKCGTAHAVGHTTCSKSHM